MKEDKETGLLEGLFRSLVSKDRDVKISDLTICDLSVHVDCKTAEVTLSDENDRILGSTIIYKWLEQCANTEIQVDDIKKRVRKVVEMLATESFFDDPLFSMPFSVNFSASSTNAEKEEQEEILFVDDEFVRIDDPLLIGLDDELDDFLSKLLADKE